VYVRGAEKLSANNLTRLPISFTKQIRITTDNINKLN